MSELLKQIDEFCQAVSQSMEPFKPKPEPRRDEFSAGLPTEFRKLWEMTENWERWTAPNRLANFEVMSHEMFDLADDGTTSKSRCKGRAERQLQKAYTEAERFLGTMV